MERFFNVLLILCGLVNPLCSQTLSTVITFEERIHDFGTILEKNGKVSHSFVFHNTGKTPVAIDDIYSGCGCIGRALSKVPVKAGGKGEVKIIFNPEYKSGFFSKEVVVYSNKGQNYNRVWVQGVITPAEHPVKDDYPYEFGGGLYLRLKVMVFGPVKPGQTGQMDLNYANNTDKEMYLNFAVEGNKTGLKFTSPGKIGAKARGVMSVSYTMPFFSRDDVVFFVDPYVNNKKLKENLEVKILNEVKVARKEQARPKVER